MKTLFAFAFLFSFNCCLLAQTPSCALSAEATRTMWNKYGPWKPIGPYVIWVQRANKAVYLWKKAINNKGKTLHRSLEYGQVVNETIRGTRYNAHTYITPPASEKTVILSFQKRSGKGRANLIICTTPNRKNAKNEYTYTFEPSSPATTRIITIDNAKGKVISIRIEKEPGADFTYRLEDQTSYPPLLCYASADKVTTMWDEYGNWKPLLSPALRAQKVSRAITDYNSALNNQGNTVGPDRSLSPGGNEVETIGSKDHYTYVMAPTDKNTIKLTLIKRGGQAQTDVNVCVTAKNGDPDSAYSYTFERGSYTRTQQITINNARRKVISINIKNIAPSGTFEYQLRDITP